MRIYQSHLLGLQAQACVLIGVYLPWEDKTKQNTLIPVAPLRPTFEGATGLKFSTATDQHGCILEQQNSNKNKTVQAKTKKEIDFC